MFACGPIVTITLRQATPAITVGAIVDVVLPQGPTWRGRVCKVLTSTPEGHQRLKVIFFAKDPAHG